MEFFLSYFFGWIVGIIAHEGGHALFGWLAGCSIKLVRIGSGPRLFSFRLHDFELDVRLYAIHGFVLTYPIIPERPLRFFFYVAGGVLGNIALVLATAPLWFAGDFGNLDQRVLGFVSAQATLILLTLFPHEFFSDRAKYSSDGFKLWQLLLSPQSIATEVADAYGKSLARYGGATIPFKSLTSASHRILLYLAKNAPAADRRDRQSVRKDLMGELARQELSTAEEVLVLETLITDAVIYGDEDALPFLESWSARAAELAPGSATVKFSRAAALIELGRYTEGRDLLLNARNSNESAFESTLNAIFLAKAEMALGDQERAGQLLAKAEGHIDADIPVHGRPRLRQLLSRARAALPKESDEPALAG